MPAMTITTTKTTTATSASRTSAAASARGMCRASRRTSGIATTATMSAQTIGPTIVYVSASSQIRPKTTSSIPTSSHELRPRSRSQRGVANESLRRARPVPSVPCASTSLRSLLRPHGACVIPPG